MRRVPANLAFRLWRGRNAAEFEPESAAVAQGGFDAAPAAHSFHGAGNNREADAGPFVFAGAVAALEDAKYLALGFGRDADAIVFKPKPDARSVQIMIRLRTGLRNGVTGAAELAGFSFAALGSGRNQFGP